MRYAKSLGFGVPHPRASIAHRHAFDYAARQVQQHERAHGDALQGAGISMAVLSNKLSAYVTGAAIVVDGGLSLTNWFEPPEIVEL